MTERVNQLSDFTFERLLVHTKLTKELIFEQNPNLAEHDYISGRMIGIGL